MQKFSLILYAIRETLYARRNIIDRIVNGMIRSFADREAQKIFQRIRSKKLPDANHRRAQRKLAMVDAAVRLQDLRVPPGNRLEKLGGEREGQYSIRINEQWRICFRWENGNAYAVEITDYH